MKKYSMFLMVIFMSGCAAHYQQLNKEKFFSLDKQHFKNTITIKDDEFEPTVVITTAKGFSEKYGLLGIVWNDAFLRGFINKNTGDKSIQVYVIKNHQGDGWLFPYQVNYGKPLRTQEVIKIDSDVDCTGSTYTGCTYFEHFAFDVDESELRRIQNESTEEDFKTKAWLFKVKCKSGEDYMEGLPLPEIIAFLEVMDSYKPVKAR